MVAIDIIKASNAQISSLPELVALFIGATQGIGKTTLEHLARNAPASLRIYTTARPGSLEKHQADIASLRAENPNCTFEVIEADASLIADVDKIVAAVRAKETKLDLLVLTAGFLAFDGRKLTPEGHEASMATGFYTRLRALQQLVPLLNESANPRVVSVLAGGREGPVKEDDLGLQVEGNWSTWQAAIHSTTMGTLLLERFAKQNPGLSIVHWYPGPVDTAALKRAVAGGAANPSAAEIMSYSDGGARCLFYATSDRYGVNKGLVPVPEGLEGLQKSGGGIFLLDPLGEHADSEKVLADFRARGVDEAVWEHAKKAFAAASS